MSGQANNFLGDHTEAPDLLEPVTAWRTWYTKTKKGKISLLSFSSGTVWSPSMHADCVLKDTENENHDNVPDANCGCGLYGFFNAQDAHYINKGVLGVCEYWGKTQVHKNGIRAQHARIKAVCFSPVKSSGDSSWTVDYFLAGILLFMVLMFKMALGEVAETVYMLLLGVLVLGLVFGKWRKVRRLKAWSETNGIVVCKTVEELQAYNNNPLPNNLKV